MAIIVGRPKKITRQKVPQVAVLLESSHEISRGMLRGIIGYVQLYGPWALHLISGGADDQRLPDLRTWRGDGIIARIPNNEVGTAITTAQLPTVVIDPTDEYLDPSHPLSCCSRVTCNSAAVANMAVDHFMGLGFKNFAFVGEPAGLNWSRWREAAYKERLASEGFSCACYPVPSEKERKLWELDRRRMCSWLQLLPKPAAIFAANDARGRQVLNACLAAGIPVPYEVTVLGVNNDPIICESSIPPLSSIAIEMEQAGHEAAVMLDQLMSGAVSEQRCIEFGPTEVVVRASTRALQVSDRLVIKALEYIRINAGLNIRVSDVADHVGVTPRWLEKRFTASLGRTVIDEIQQLRMETIHALVTRTTLTFSEIAKRCGFTNANYLGVIFKNSFGCTMSEKRNSTNDRYSFL